MKPGRKTRVMALGLAFWGLSPSKAAENPAPTAEPHYSTLLGRAENWPGEEKDALQPWYQDIYGPDGILREQPLGPKAIYYYPNAVLKYVPGTNTPTFGPMVTPDSPQLPNVEIFYHLAPKHLPGRAVSLSAAGSSGSESWSKPSIQYACLPLLETIRNGFQPFEYKGTTITPRFLTPEVQADDVREAIKPYQALAPNLPMLGETWPKDRSQFDVIHGFPDGKVRTSKGWTPIGELRHVQGSFAAYRLKDWRGPGRDSFLFDMPPQPDDSQRQWVYFAEDWQAVRQYYSFASRIMVPAPQIYSYSGEDYGETSFLVQIGDDVYLVHNRVARYTGTDDGEHKTASLSIFRWRKGSSVLRTYCGINFRDPSEINKD